MFLVKENNMLFGRMRRMHGAAVVGVLVALAFAGTARAGQAAKADVTGTWAFNVQTDAGAGTPTVTLKQDGEKLTGHYSSETLGEADLTGDVKGSAVAFTFSAQVQGFSLPVSYSGTLENPTTMKGTLSITGVGDGTFTATKK
jgi:hypothetical protein